MRILVVGSGGREHALAWKLSSEAEVFCAPGNPGIAEDATVIPVSAKDHASLAQLVKQESIDLVVVGPEDPLIEGLADHLRSIGVAVFGPGADAAQLEGSKAFSKEIMVAANVPTAQHEAFTEAEPALDYVRAVYGQGRQVAVKASGNALGKGVVVADTLEQAKTAVQSMLVDRIFGEAGSNVVIEDRLIGREFSLLTLVGDHNIYSLPIAQDHKRAFDGDQGPNTGGMGTYSPCQWVSDDLVRQAEEQMVLPAIAELRKRGSSYRGVLFTGVMVQDGVPYCLEYNVRFGDPETQSVLARIGSGFADALFQAATGSEIVAPQVLERAAATVVIASGGYPGSYAKGVPIEIDALPANTKLFHAGTAMKDGQLVTAGGRVFGLTGWAEDAQTARKIAYDALKNVRFDGAFYRNDIGAQM